MEYFFNVNTGQVEQRPTNQQFYPGTTVPIAVPFSSSTNQQNLFTPTEPYVSPTYIQKQQLGMVPTGITASSAAIPFGSPIDIQQGFTKNTPSDTGTNFQFLPSANEADETDEVKETKTGIAKLFDFLSNFIPGVGLLKRLGDPGGIRSLNQRLRNTDFAQSRTMTEFLEKRRRRRDEAAAINRAETRDLQNKIDAGKFNTGKFDKGITDRGRGNRTFSTKTTAPTRSFSKSYSDAKSAFTAGRR